MPSAPGAPGIQINVRAIYPNALPLSYCSWGALFTPAKAQVSHARLEEVVARECNDNTDLSWNRCFLSWARKEVPKSRCARLGQKLPDSRMLSNGWGWDGDR